MPLGLTTDQKSWLDKRVKRIALMVELDFDGMPARFWNGMAPYEWNSKLFHGLGPFTLIEGIGSEQSLVGNEISIGLQGIPGEYLGTVPSDIMALSRTREYQGRDLSIWGVFTHPDTDVPVATPFELWQGEADVMSFQLGSEISISLSGNHYSGILRAAAGWRCTTYSHNLRLALHTGEPYEPGTATADYFFEFNRRLNGTKATKIA